MPAQGKADDIQKTFAHKLGGDTDAGKKKLLLQKVTFMPSDIPKLD